MTLKSMTGFARTEGTHGPYRWHWEVRSVNGRGLDVRLRLPPGFDVLDVKVRDAVTKRFVRGSLNVSLNVQRQTEASDIRINEAALAQVIKAAERVRALTGAPPPAAEGLLALKGVLEVSESSEDEAAIAALHQAMLASLDAALTLAAQSRAAEGARLALILGQQVDEIDRLVGIVEASPARTAAAIKERLSEMVSRIMDAGPGLDPARLHQEAVLLATRADVEEEVKRLHAHIASARELLVDPAPVGRRFDFLAQEFNREANTLTSKANDPGIARAGLSLKSVIDQMREQVQNIE